MREIHEKSERVRRASGSPCRWPAWALALCLPLVGAACSGFDVFGDENADSQASAEDEPYPNLSRVPSEQPRPTPESLRKELVEGLVADRRNAQYTSEALTVTSTAVPPAAPPPAANPQVEIVWETLRVLPEEESVEEPVEEPAAEEAESPESQSEADTSETSAGEGQEEIQINWESERVEPSGDVRLAGFDKDGESLILAPGPELVGVVYFAHDSAQVGQSERELLEDVIALYKERGGRLRLIGHASSQTGTEDEIAQRMVNLDMSLKRANAVATTLVDLGAEQDKLLVEAKADSEPAMGEEGALPASGEFADRRVEIFLEN